MNGFLFKRSVNRLKGQRVVGSQGDREETKKHNQDKTVI